jgi:hypothetical protein
MSVIRPETLTDKELLQAAYILWNDDTGVPVLFQKEMLKRIEGLLDKVSFQEILQDPKQLRLFED